MKRLRTGSGRIDTYALVKQLERAHRTTLRQHGLLPYVVDPYLEEYTRDEIKEAIECRKQTKILRRRT